MVSTLDSESSDYGSNPEFIVHCTIAFYDHNCLKKSRSQHLLVVHLGWPPEDCLRVVSVGKDGNGATSSV